MKNASVYASRVRKLFTRIKKEGAKAQLATPDDPVKIMLLAVFCNYSTEQRAAAAVEKLIGEMVDVNELRVTPIADIVRCVGVQFPKCRTAAEEVSQVLNSIFNRTHDLELAFLKSFSGKAAHTFLNSLDGLSPHTKGFFGQRYLSDRMIPLDQKMYLYLRKSQCIAENADVEEAQRFVSGVIKERDTLNFYTLLKRYAATHAPPRLKPKSGKKKKSPFKAKAARKAAKKKTAKKKAATRAAAGRKKSTAAKAASKKSSAAKRRKKTAGKKTDATKKPKSSKKKSSARSR